ncbi:MAG: lipid biosynthesis B12-binding/radical SAM protein [Kiritimatiellae bacterium]|nr:lipid biosynthesis B12-binding/radical SAM protein [Kiritimatiellia bacterium]
MKILLIASNIARTPYPVYPLGMGMIAGALTNAGHAVAQFDFLQHDMSLDAITTAVTEEQPNIIGISIRNIDNTNMMNEQHYIGIVKGIVDRIRNHTSAKVILGGSAFSILPDAVLAATGADYGVIGEGEQIIVDFVNNAANGIYPNKKIITTEQSLQGTDIISAQYDRQVLDFYLQNGHVGNVQTKRGCPYSCIYCSYPSLEGKKIRVRDPKAVLQDMQSLIDDHGAKMIFFTDSVFNDRTGKYRALLQLMKKEKISIPWSGFITPDKLNEHDVELMKETGLIAAEMGSDAASDTTLAGLGKSFRFADIAKYNDLFAQYEIAIAHYYMFGGPGETKETVKEGIKNIISLKNSVSFMFMGIRILPDTKLQALACQKGIITPEQDLFDPVYYIEPGLDEKWLEENLLEGFKPYRHCIFPPDALEASAQFLHKMGHDGLLWDMLIPGKNKRKRKKDE